jgi:nucleotide-binding universal stress UspA family protein
MKVIVSPKRILWPTDFSPLSFKAAEYARGFRGIFGADLHIVHVLVGSVAERVVQHASCPVLVVKSVERDFTQT